MSEKYIIVDDSITISIPRNLHNTMMEIGQNNYICYDQSTISPTTLYRSIFDDFIYRFEKKRICKSCGNIILGVDKKHRYCSICGRINEIGKGENV